MVLLSMSDSQLGVCAIQSTGIWFDAHDRISCAAVARNLVANRKMVLDDIQFFV